MKKLLAISFALLYLVSSAGATINIHYCMGELADWTVGKQESKICGGCGMEKAQETDNGCCRDEQQFIKNSSDQKAIDISFQLLIWQQEAPVAILFSHTFPKIASQATEFPLSHAPPRSGRVASYIRYCSILI